jgi:glutamyl-tRNA synthetase
MNMNEKIVTRFAPSPTGFMHIGGIRTALFAYLFARKNNGTFILRIEDTDKEREVPGSIEHIQESLLWLGIEWDYGPDKPGPFGSCIQSERLDSYKAYAQKLIDKGLAYPDPYTKEEVSAFREQAAANKVPFLFRNHRPEVFEAWDESKPLRLKVPEVKRYQWHDEVRGDLEAGEEMLDDVILIKADGYPTYNFAHIIDDLQMGVTHIMRGDEFISSTPKFLSIYDALEIEHPKFVTLPPILRDDRTKKLGKRDGAKDILEYKKEGYLPEAMLNFLVLIGWNPGTNQELFSKEEITDAFDIAKIQKSGGAFNEEKLLWMNREYIQRFTDDELFAYVLQALPERIKELPQYSEAVLHRLLPIIRERVHIQKEITEAAEAGEYDFAFVAPDVPAELIAWKNDTKRSDVLPRLEKAQELLQNADFSSQEAIKEALWGYAEEVGKGELLWPLRVALTGREQSPDPFICAYIIGKEETLLRIKNACAKITEGLS